MIALLGIQTKEYSKIKIVQKLLFYFCKNTYSYVKNMLQTKREEIQANWDDLDINRSYSKVQPKPENLIISYFNINFVILNIKILSNILYTTFSSLPLCIVFSVILSKSWSLEKSWTKFYIKIFLLEITSKKIFLIFLFMKYDTTILQLLF